MLSESCRSLKMLSGPVFQCFQCFQCFHCFQGLSVLSVLCAFNAFSAFKRPYFWSPASRARSAFAVPSASSRTCRHSCRRRYTAGKIRGCPSCPRAGTGSSPPHGRRLGCSGRHNGVLSAIARAPCVRRTSVTLATVSRASVAHLARLKSGQTRLGQLDTPAHVHQVLLDGLVQPVQVHLVVLLSASGGFGHSHRAPPPAWRPWPQGSPRTP
jgi:hypothetical protein